MMPVDVEICACGTEEVAHQPYRARQPARRERARLPAGIQALARADASTRLDRTTGMRLNPHQRQTIKQAVHTCFGADATVRLFGSRIDDSKRGGDIDVLISTSLTDPDAIARAEIAFQVRGQLGYVERAEDWPRLCAIRNQCAHEYPDEPERNASVLNMAIDAVDTLQAMRLRIVQRLKLETNAP